MRTPEDLKYSEEHEWLRVTEETTDDGRKIAYVGITDFAQGELGELVYVEVDSVGDVIKANEAFGTLEAVKTTSDLYMPVTGEILEFNPDLDENEGDNPGLINSDPYGDGWIVKVAIDNDDDIGQLMDSKAYQNLVQ